MDSGGGTNYAAPTNDAAPTKNDAAPTNIATLMNDGGDALGTDDRHTGRAAIYGVAVLCEQ